VTYYRYYKTGADHNPGNIPCGRVNRVAWQKGPRLLRLCPFRHANLPEEECFSNVRNLTYTTASIALEALKMFQSANWLRPILETMYIFGSLRKRRMLYWFGE
jgi:hypothetical protein